MILEMKNISKYFGPVKALSDVSFTVRDSEIHGLLGENGAGKTTLMNILAGAFPPSSGQIYFNGEEIKEMTTRKSTALGIRFIHQELNLVNDLKVYENLFLGEEIKNKYGFLDKKTMIKRSAKVFERMKVEIDPEEMVEYLETSRKQLVEIAKALLFESKLIIMDEPTTALTNKEIQSLFDIMRILKKEGVSIIYISHKMPELFEICDEYTVLRDGKFIDSGKFKDINEKKVTELLVGRKIIDLEIEERTISDEELLSVEGLTCSVFKDISFKLRCGEVLAITGLHGDGRRELAEALFGARKVDSGTISLHGKVVGTRSIKNVMNSGIAMVPRNRKERAIIKDMNILDNLSIAFFVNSHKNLFIKRADEIRRYTKNKEAVGIKAGDPQNLITSLSGGNQQKVIISRWLELDSDVYILDNPTQGIDVGAKFEIYKLISNLAKKGKGLVVFSSEFPEIWKIADRCIVMYKGGINTILSREQLSEENVMFYATGSNLEVQK
ncbi:sugar ABC transporter ATP-binding protein [Geosporobacter ferrireducens]|uniref:ABC transporter n=1 Tax=Geosporobacter ferrireducens TaxID=1424294 RepID=A0A1D8GNS3_9FIRM|nr:sugar ABC transporter ATP-binding protein [Geosporobacter ferrireducens]AOT72568.1 ABC transporter [Geosporobacter ferrireducens]MTI54964.1 sugar ABC transporter ATP-binding protein [Geosporobacter ferrireducens]